MNLGRKRETPPPTVYVGDYTDKLMRLRPIAHDDDERQTREDLRYGETLFDHPPGPLPRIFRRRRKRRG